MIVTIDLSEVRHLAADLRSAGARVEPAVDREVGRGGYRVQGRAQVNAPKDTGNLAESISTDLGHLSYEVGPEASYGGFVEEGTTGPYPIENAFGRGILVMHPGISPQPYLGPAFDAELPRTERGILRTAADRTLG
ncbi:HK97 gp10 family phage protein [Nocardioides sp. L-11A]|uniref:HK97 gp10 family phage protein n=1 Tax=Nocardioides sp. L-11A TaxID=3043848 RepID=UPI00249A9ABA|nr:HK97 gp10 family phage protein [Nocardioides sp. L-11A]